jgi:hypothetical protein
MAVTKTQDRNGYIGWHSSLDGGTYDSEVAARFYDDQERQKSSRESPGSKLIDSLSLDQLKSLATEARVEAEQTDGRQDWLQVQEEFVDANPEFLPNQRNAAALQAALLLSGKLTRNGVFLGTVDDVREAWLDLAEKGGLEPRPGVRLPQRVDTAEIYKPPLEEIEKRARGWN